MVITEFNPRGQIYQLFFTDMGNLLPILERDRDFKKVLIRRAVKEPVAVAAGGAELEPPEEPFPSILCWYDSIRQSVDIGFMENKTFWVTRREYLLMNLKTTQETIECHFSTKYEAKIHNIEKL